MLVATTFVHLYIYGGGEGATKRESNPEGARGAHW